MAYKIVFNPFLQGNFQYVSVGGGSGSTLTPETPTGTVDDSNVTFTVTHTPLYIDVNGSQYRVGQGMFATYGAGTITLTAPVGSTGFITSWYNA